MILSLDTVHNIVVSVQLSQYTSNRYCCLVTDIVVAVQQPHVRKQLSLSLKVLIERDLLTSIGRYLGLQGTFSIRFVK
jgi:hypothetical protein